MNDPAIAQMIREVLAEELGKLRTGQGNQAAQSSGPETLTVSVGNDGELQDLVRRVLAMAATPSTRAALETGKTVFRLQGATTNRAVEPLAPQARVSDTTIERGVMSERMVDRLPAGTKRILIGKAVRMTPLAKDRLRQRRITVERNDS